MTVHFLRALAHGGQRVFAEQKPEELFRQLRDGINDFKAHHNERLTNMETALNAIGAGNPAISAPALNAASDAEYSRTFASYFRKATANVLRKANSTGERATIQAS